jgi:predicted RNA-binding Zn ribbon-like protein
MAMDHASSSDIELITGFTNTVNLEDGPEELTTPAALRDWLAGQGLLTARARVRGDDLTRAIALREAIRALVAGNNACGEEPDAATVLDDTAVRAGVRLRFDCCGDVRAEATAEGVDGALGRIVAAVHATMADGSWSRLKACARDECRRVYFDASRNRSKRWCSMGVCGNREKGEAFRRRHRDDHPAGHAHG